MRDAEGLIKKHRAKGVFLEANLLVLLVVGLVNAERIQHFKRTQDFTKDDFLMLKRLVDWFGAPLIATPHVLSQVRNLTDLKGREHIAARELLRTTIEVIEERYDPAKQLVQHPLFRQFGLGDASVAAVCERNILVLTADLQLQIALAARGLDALNFNHVLALPR